MIEAKSQDSKQYGYIDKIILSIPVSETNSTSGIASYINSNFDTELEKVRAIHTWLALNISYDKDSVYTINSEKNPEMKITEALRRRKGVCENFAALFNDLSLKCSITSFLVNGYTKQYGSIDKTGHSWCVVYIDHDWFLCDPTWDEDFINSTSYFLLTPQQFIETHMPFDPLWQLTDIPISHEQFYKGLFYYTANKRTYNFLDSVNSFLKLGELQRLRSTANRMRTMGTSNELTNIYLRFIEMQIGIIYEDHDMQLYNAAVNDFNQANSTFNNYIEYRNNRFLPTKPDVYISNLLGPIEDMLRSSLSKIDSIGSNSHSDQYDASVLKNRIFSLKRKVTDQQEFLKTYLSIPLNNREQLFYK